MNNVAKHFDSLETLLMLSAITLVLVVLLLLLE